jgi:hypothetical protein
MEVIWKRSHSFLVADGRNIPCWSKVRNELNGYRPDPDKMKRDDADLFCITEPNGRPGGGPPSMPRPFPVGEWKITGVNPHPNPLENHGYLYPFYICTNAHQLLDVWELDDGGFYFRKTGEKKNDSAYGLHFSTSDWTQGCIRIAAEADLRWLVEHVKAGDPFVVTD